MEGQRRYINKRLKLREGDRIIAIKGKGTVSVRIPRHMVISVQSALDRRVLPK